LSHDTFPGLIYHRNSVAADTARELTVYPRPSSDGKGRRKGEIEEGKEREKGTGKGRRVWLTLLTTSYINFLYPTLVTADNERKTYQNTLLGHKDTRMCMCVNDLPRMVR